MPCANCNDRPGEPATVHFTSEGRRVAVELCPACADAYGEAPRCHVERRPVGHIQD